ncbi:site-specific integrase [Williamsia muralis]|uniref:site-specific integrase n=1 Tax=Williamsia marianensis TaxID=85044 RepID=UPI0037DCDE02
MLALALGYTGIRRGEATGLRVRGVNTLRKRLVVRDNAVEVDGMIIEGTTKSHRERTVPVPSFPMGRISALCEGRAARVAVVEGREAPATAAVHPRFGGSSRSLRPSFHASRRIHTAASLAVEAGANVKAIQKDVGHSSVAMTLDVYAELFDDGLDDVANRLDSAVGIMWANGPSDCSTCMEAGVQVPLAHHKSLRRLPGVSYANVGDSRVTERRSAASRPAAYPLPIDRAAPPCPKSTSTGDRPAGLETSTDSNVWSNHEDGRNRRRQRATAPSGLCEGRAYGGDG